jgi:hypothetical protein
MAINTNVEFDKKEVKTRYQLEMTKGRTLLRRPCSRFQALCLAVEVPATACFWATLNLSKMVLDK